MSNQSQLLLKYLNQYKISSIDINLNWCNYNLQKKGKENEGSNQFRWMIQKQFAESFRIRYFGIKDVFKFNQID